MCDCDRNITDVTVNETIKEKETCSYVMSHEEEDICCALTEQLGIGKFVICITGLIFNTIAILLLVDKKLYNDLFNRLLLCLIMTDNVYLVIGLVETWLGDIGQPTYNQLYFYFFIIYPARGMTLCCIIYLTVMLALQRYKAVTRPIQNQTRNVNLITGVLWSQVMKFVGPDGLNLMDE